MILTTPNSTKQAAPTSWQALPTTIIERLAARGISTGDDWRALSRRQKRSIFGITSAMGATIDRAARMQRT